MSCNSSSVWDKKSTNKQMLDSFVTNSSGCMIKLSKHLTKEKKYKTQTYIKHIAHKQIVNRSSNFCWTMRHAQAEIFKVCS